MEATLKTFLGRETRAARLRLDLTQVEVAGRVKLSAAVYGRIERGLMLPSLPTLLRLCRALELDANALLGFSAPTPPPWLTATRPARQRRAVHSLLRTARRLRPWQLTALGTVAHALRRSGETPHGS